LPRRAHLLCVLGNELRAIGAEERAGESAQLQEEPGGGDKFTYGKLNLFLKNVYLRSSCFGEHVVFEMIHDRRNIWGSLRFKTLIRVIDNLTLFQLEVEELQDNVKISEEKYR
jgi:hypothetical protein